MRILIAAAGSRGDVAPYTGLGAELRRAGHEVALAAPDAFAPLVAEAGLEFRGLPARAEGDAATKRELIRAAAEFITEPGRGLCRARPTGGPGSKWSAPGGRTWTRPGNSPRSWRTSSRPDRARCSSGSAFASLTAEAFADALGRVVRQQTYSRAALTAA